MKSSTLNRHITHQRANVENDVISLINKIWDMEGESLSQKILDYCETYDFDELEIGEILSQSQDFKKMFYRDCVKNHLIEDEKLKETFTTPTVSDEW